ncbi:MAG: AraC family transcriptional regulator, partial [Lachnospiraceae bacterium]|nr:AraC family transcriptional regulator [Lachnospiraceae bacterium]
VETSYKIIDLAENVGFHNVSYFSRAFHSKYGETPSSYRNHYAADFTASHS